MARIANQKLIINGGTGEAPTSKNLKSATFRFDVIPERIADRTVTGTVFLLVKWSRRRNLADAFFSVPYSTSTSPLERSVSVSVKINISSLVASIAHLPGLNNARFSGFISIGSPLGHDGLVVFENPTPVVYVPIVP